MKILHLIIYFSLSRFSIINIITAITLIPICCSHEKSSEFRWDDHDEFDKAGQQGETECESSDE